MVLEENFGRHCLPPQVLSENHFKVKLILPSTNLFSLINGAKQLSFFIEWGPGWEFTKLLTQICNIFLNFKVLFHRK